MALLNSHLLAWYFRVKANEFDDLFPQIKVTEFKDLPIKKTTSQSPIINLVDQILVAKRANPAADTSALETEIDRLVYQLYGLTEEEIAIVEGKGPTPNPSLKGGEMKDGEMKGGKIG